MFQHKLFIEAVGLSGLKMAEKLIFYEAGNKVFRSTCVWPIEFVEEGQTVLGVTLLSD